MKPVATVGSMHVCPMCSGTVPHVGGPVVMGDSTVLMNGKPVALMGDMCTCAAGPPDVIVTGNPSILVNGKPIACVGDMTAHGGAIVQGEPNILVGTATPVKRAIMPVNKIPFPKIRVRDRIGAAITGNSAKLKEARENQEQLRNEAEDDNLQLSNLLWKKDGTKTDIAIIDNEVMLTADVTGVDDGNIVRLQILEKSENEDEINIASISARVENQKIEAAWIPKYNIRKKLSECEENQYIEPKLVFKGTTTNTSITESNTVTLYAWLKSLLKMERTSEVLPNTDCTLHHPDGSTEELRSDEEGFVHVEQLKIGKYKISLKSPENE